MTPSQKEFDKLLIRKTKTIYSLGGGMGGEEMLIIKGAPMAKDGQIEIQNLPLNKIKLGKNSRLGNSSLDGLMQSIKEEGLLQPIGVVKNGSGYEICYGNRRFMACSKLGFARIPAIIHESKKTSDIDLKNLTENIQRRNITLVEAGRYIELLKAAGLTKLEIGVRLGVSSGYIESCTTAYQEVPKEFRDDLELQTGNQKAKPGAISIKVARSILNAQKTYRLDYNQGKELFKAAKSDERFSVENVPKYAAALKHGKKDFVAGVKAIKTVRLNIVLSEDDYDSLTEKFVTDGPFRSLTALFTAVLKGEKSLKVPVV